MVTASPAMVRWFQITLVLAMLCATGACTKTPSEAGEGSPASAASADPGDETGKASAVSQRSGRAASKAEAEAMLREFMRPGADHVALTRALQPLPSDYRLVFTSAEDARKAEQMYRSLWDNVAQQPLAPLDNQTELLVYSATLREILADAKLAKRFPAAYARVGDRLNLDLVLYHFRFIDPSSGAGMTSEGLYNIDGRWVFMPKPWQVLER